MNHPACSKSESRSGLGGADCTTAQTLAGFQKFGPGCVVNHPVQPAAAQQVRVRRVDDGFYVEIADVRVDGQNAFGKMSHLVDLGIWSVINQSGHEDQFVLLAPFPRATPC